MSSLWAASSVLLAAALAAGPTLKDDGLGTELRQDGYAIRPPQGFRMLRMDLFHGTRAGAVGGAGVEARYLSAALADGPSEDAASLLISLVEGPFQVTPSARDEFSTAVVRHYADELGLPFTMERADSVVAATPRVEVVGTVKQEHQARAVLVAAMAGEGRHAVITVSAPSGRWQELAPVFTAALGTFRNDVPGRVELGRGIAAALALAVAAALIASLALWRRRRRLRP